MFFSSFLLSFAVHKAIETQRFRSSTIMHLSKTKNNSIYFYTSFTELFELLTLTFKKYDVPVKLLHKKILQRNTKWPQCAYLCIRFIGLESCLLLLSLLWKSQLTGPGIFKQWRECCVRWVGTIQTGMYGICSKKIKKKVIMTNARIYRLYATVLGTSQFVRKIKQRTI